MSNSAEEQDLSLEQVMEQLEEVLTELGDDDCSLERAFSLYKTGMQLVVQGNERLDRVEKQMLQMDEKGALHEFSGGAE